MELQNIEVWFTDQNSQPLEIEDGINLALVIRLNIYWCIKMRWKLKNEIEIKNEIAQKEQLKKQQKQRVI